MSPRGENFLRSFLASSRGILATASKSTAPIPIVIGNESADLDSFASSLLYACLTPLKPNPVPFLAIPRAELSLRPEFHYLLKQLHLTPADLLCADDAESFATINPSQLELHLVDHNKLTLPQSGPQVRGIIDHHDDEGAHLSASPRIVTKAGSCTSLVINEFLSAAELEEEGRTQVITLALAAVLIDTANMTQKVTAHDEAALRVLVMPEGWDRAAFYAGLHQAKADVSGLTLRELLRKDYKEWTEGKRKLGVSSVVKGILWLKEREEGGKEAFLEGLRKWAEERGLDVVGLMTTDGKGEGFRRELLLWAAKDEGKNCVKLFEKRAPNEGMRLEAWGDGELDEGGVRMAWSQGNLAISRKQVAPLLRECLRVGDRGAASKA